MRQDKEGTSGTGVIVIAVIAFAIGRCSASPTPPSSAPTAVEPSAFVATQPVEAPPEQTVEEPKEELVDPAPQSHPVEEASEPEVYYSRCADARAAGAAPIHVGEPGYASHLDRDGDGVACE
jgi:hypothetical protein